MKVNCSQCGAEQVVVESDFFLRCPYCDSRIVVMPPALTPELVDPAVSEEYARRLFPSGMVLSVEMKYFPWLENVSDPSSALVPCFKQPWQDLDGYVPPAGDRKLFDESLADPGDLIPFDRDSEEEMTGRIIFHPFYIVMLKMEGYGEGVLVDAVSGSLLGESPLAVKDGSGGGGLERLFVKSLLIGLLVSIPIYLITGSLDATVISRIWSYAAAAGVAAFLYYVKFRKR